MTHYTAGKVFVKFLHIIIWDMCIMGTVADGVSILYQVATLTNLSQFEYLNIIFPNRNVGKYSQS